RLAPRPGRLAWCSLPSVGRSAAVERRSDRAGDIDAREFAFVSGRAAHVRDALGFVGGGIAGAREGSVIDGRADKRSFRGLEAHGLLGRGADDDARALDRPPFPPPPTPAPHPPPA